MHCIATLSLLSSRISPWRVRERIWRHFGDLRLLHLLENEVLIHSVIGLLDASEAEGVYATTGSDSHRHSKSPMNHNNNGGRSINDSNNKSSSKSALIVSKAIAVTLSNLREESDKNFHICTVGIIHVAASIFCFHRIENGQSVFQVKGPQTRLLKDLLCDTDVPDWIIMNIILSVEKYFLRETKGEPLDHRGQQSSGEKRRRNIFDEFHRTRISSNNSALDMKTTYFPIISSVEVCEMDGKLFNLFDFIKTFRPCLSEEH